MLWRQCVWGKRRKYTDLIQDNYRRLALTLLIMVCFLFLNLPTRKLFRMFKPILRTYHFFDESCI